MPSAKSASNANRSIDTTKCVILHYHLSDTVKSRYRIKRLIEPFDPIT